MPTIIQIIRSELEAFKRQVVLVYNGLYAAVVHTHPSTDITDFTEAAQDAVGALVAAGTGLSYVDASPASLSATGGGTVTHTAGALTANQVVIGNGAADLKTLGTLGTTTTLLHGNAAGAPTFGAVSLTADVSGDLPFANLAQGAALSVLGVTGNATADVASIAAASDKQVLRRSGTAVAFGAVDLTSSAAVTGILPIANIATGTPNGSQFVRDDGTLATPAGAGNVSGPGTAVDGEGVLFDGTSGTLLKRATGTGVVHRTSGVDAVGDVTFAELPQIAGLSVLGVTGSSTADVAAITAANAGELLQRVGSTVVFSDIGFTKTALAASTDSDSDNTLHNDPELLIAIGANEVGIFDVFIGFTTGTSTTPDAQVAFTIPSGATMTWGMTSLATGATTATPGTMLGTTAAATGVGVGVLSTATIPISIARYYGTVRNGATPGNLQLQWAQNTTTGGTPTVRQINSWIRYTRIS